MSEPTVSLTSARQSVSTEVYTHLQNADREVGDNDGQISSSEIETYIRAHRELTTLIRGQVSQYAQTLSGRFTLPTSYTLDEHMISMTTKFSIMNGSQILGSISADFFSLTPTFTMYDASGNVVASGRVRFLSLNTVIDIRDANGQNLGSISENMFSTMMGLGITTSYSLLDARGNRVGESNKFQLGSTSFSINNGSQPVATLSRPWINMTGDTWTVSTNNTGSIDPRVLAFIGPFKTMADARRAE